MLSMELVLPQELPLPQSRVKAPRLPLVTFQATVAPLLVPLLWPVLQPPLELMMALPRLLPMPLALPAP